MTADKIRDTINDEVHNLDKAGQIGALMALEKFSRLASNAELIRFRELIIGLPDLKLPHAATE